MSDYRFQIVDHNGLESLLVMIDGEDGETYIPIDDIQATIERYRQEQHPESRHVSSSIERVLIVQDTLENGDYLFKTEYGSLITEQMAREQVVLLMFTRALRKIQDIGKERIRFMIEISPLEDKKEQAE